MIQVKPHSASNDEKLWLLKARDGSEISAHGHNGHKFTVDLQCSYSDVGHRYNGGDMELAPDDIENHPT